jgi:uncharacterized protein (TIGR02588 family)
MERGGSVERDRGKERTAGTSPWEWGVGGISTLLVAGMIGFMLYEGVAKPSTPAAIVVEAGRPERAGGGWRVEVTARNGGRSTAADLRVTGELMAGDSTVESSEATIDYVPAGSGRRAVLWFSRDPARYRLEVRPTGHDEP